RGGNFGIFEHLYARAPLDDAGRFVVLSTGGDSHVRIPRVPSTFTSVSQYYGFAIVALACALSMLARRRNGAWLAVAAIRPAAALASGARAAYVTVPALAIAGFIAARPDRATIAALALAHIVSTAPGVRA